MLLHRLVHQLVAELLLILLQVVIAQHSLLIQVLEKLLQGRPHLAHFINSGAVGQWLLQVSYQRTVNGAELVGHNTIQEEFQPALVAVKSFGAQPSRISRNEGIDQHLV